MRRQQQQQQQGEGEGVGGVCGPEYYLIQRPLPELDRLRSGRGLRLKGIFLPPGLTWWVRGGGRQGGGGYGYVLCLGNRRGGSANLDDFRKKAVCWVGERVGGGGGGGGGTR